MTDRIPGKLVLEDGFHFHGQSIGSSVSSSGEVVFNTGMVGYPETLTDPSYRGQILTLTYPLIGNYGVPDNNRLQELDTVFESEQIQISGLIVSEMSLDYSHWNATRSLDHWLRQEGVPALTGIDTKALTKRLRDKGCMLGKIVIDEESIDFYDPNKSNLVAEVSASEPIIYEAGKLRVVLIDCGCKNSIIKNLLARNITVIRVPWDYDFLNEKFNGLLISNGPGDPKFCLPAIENVRRVMERNIPILGICLGHQILSLAAGCNTYKLKYGHRSQNQPCKEIGTRKCYITSQNHGYAVDTRNLPDGWEPWFTNANDETNEGIRHSSRPFMGVQFHPEAAPGPLDSGSLFDKFVDLLS